MNGVVGPLNEYIKDSNPKTKWERFSGTPCIFTRPTENIFFKYFFIISSILLGFKIVFIWQSNPLIHWDYRWEFSDIRGDQKYIS